MKIFKFGGASVKDSNGVKNLLKVLLQVGYGETLIVISAMGKMTNAFEKITSSYYNKDKDFSFHLETAKIFHKKIINDLFLNQKTEILDEVELIFDELSSFTKINNSLDYNYIYDQIVSKAELLSTKICSYYLSENGVKNTWLDVRKCIKTNSDFRRAKVDWQSSCELIKNNVNNSTLFITQGFIASDLKNNTTTLGREGSDYTAGIFAYCLDAEKTIIFKDVDGILNADPRSFKNTILLNQISYREAIEMAFYGASVIHPKTLQPLQKKEIPLYVRSFNDPENEGTVVRKGVNLIPKTPCFIVKKNQILLSISAKDFSFIMENDISEIFDLFHKYKLKVNLIQNSAISFSVCLEDSFNTFNKLHENLKLEYFCLYNKNVSLFTIRHFTKASILKIEKNKNVLVKQLSRETVQFVVKN